MNFSNKFNNFIFCFIGYSNKGILTATLYMLVASVIGIVFTYITEKKINMVNIISSGLLLVSSSLTLFSGNTIFIKMKPTVLYIVFAAIFLVTNFKWQPAIKFVLGKAISLKEESKWRELNMRFMFFFIVMAVINEVVWRNFSEATWVNFKVFGALPVTILFIITQMPFIIRNKVEA